MRHRLAQALGEDHLGGTAGKWELARQHLVHDAAERIEIAPAVELVLAGRLLRTHVGRGAESESGRGELLPTRGAHRPGDAEVRHHRLVALQQNVLGLDVPVHDPLRMRVAQRGQHLPRDPEGLVQWELPLPLQALAEGLARHVGHDVVEESRGP